MTGAHEKRCRSSPCWAQRRAQSPASVPLTAGCPVPTRLTAAHLLASRQRAGRSSSAPAVGPCSPTGGPKRHLQTHLEGAVRKRRGFARRQPLTKESDGRSRQIHDDMVEGAGRWCLRGYVSTLPCQRSKEDARILRRIRVSLQVCQDYDPQAHHSAGAHDVFPCRQLTRLKTETRSSTCASRGV